jgi:hypothetical protein
MLGPSSRRLRLATQIAAGACALFLINEFLYPVAWLSMPVSGIITDQRTMQPVPGAAVNVTWNLVSATPAGPAQVRPLRVMEVVTDTQGRFQLPGWLGSRFLWGRLLSESPDLWVLRHDYRPVKIVQKHWLSSVIVVKLPMPIQLQSIRADREDKLRVSEWYQEHRNMFFSAPCAWNMLPISSKEWAALVRQAQLPIEKAGIVFEPLEIPLRCVN